MYRLMQNGVIRLSDNAQIPASDGNRDYQEYLVWLSEGGIPEPEFTLEERRANRVRELEKNEGGMVESLLPSHLQIRAVAESLALVDKATGGGQRTAAEEEKLNMRRTMWTKIAAIHAQADAKRSEILAAANPESIDIALTMP